MSRNTENLNAIEAKLLQVLGDEQFVMTPEQAADDIDRLTAEVEKLKAELNDRCPVDAMDRGMTPVEAAIRHVWGERCSDLEPECLTCRAWAEYDTIIALRAENERLRGAIEDTLNKPRDANKTYTELFVEVCCELRAALTQPAPEKEPTNG